MDDCLPYLVAHNERNILDVIFMEINKSYVLCLIQSQYLNNTRVYLQHFNFYQAKTKIK